MNTYLDGMRLSPSKAFAVGLALVFCAFGAEQASAASKKQRLEGPSVPNIMVDEGTPIIMQGLERPKRAGRSRRETSKEPERKTTERHIKIPRGSAGVVPPPSPSGGLPRTPLLGQAPAAAPYNPPPISNPSERITQFNHSFEFNKGLGNNPTDRDSYLRYNFNR
jgi:hypothetical protein